MSSATRHELDVAALYAAVSAISHHRRISSRDIAAETGLSPSTLPRLAQGQKPDADALVDVAGVAQRRRGQVHPRPRERHSRRVPAR